jgi:hypothetical protein
LHGLTVSHWYQIQEYKDLQDWFEEQDFMASDFMIFAIPMRA